MDIESRLQAVEAEQAAQRAELEALKEGGEHAPTPPKVPDEVVLVDLNGFLIQSPGPADFLYPRAVHDANKEMVRVKVEKQPDLVGVRNLKTGAITYTPEEKAAYQGWRTKALPKQPPIVWEGEYDKALADFSQALTYSYQSQTGYFPPPAGDNLMDAKESTLPGKDVSGGGGAAVTGTTEPEVDGA